MNNGRFAMALHALALLAQSTEGYSSAYIAASVNTGAPFLRRLLSILAKAGFIEAREGRDGGYRLSRSPELIPLADVYRAVTPEPVLTQSPAEPNPFCPVGSGMRHAFQDLASEMEQQFVSALGERTVADIAHQAVAYGITGSGGGAMPGP